MMELRSDFRQRLPEPVTFDQILQLDGEVFRELGGRRTFRFPIGGKGYFVKLHFGVGWKEILKNLCYLRLPVVGARNEWLAIQRLEKLGVETMKIVGFGERGLNPARRQSFLVTEELAHTVSLEDFCRDWAQESPPPRLKRALIVKVAGMARRIHENGVNHRDFYLCHFLLDRACLGAPGDFLRIRLFLIDLHRVQLRRKTPSRWVVKDVSGLYFSALDIGLNRRDLLRFMKTYRGESLRTILAGEKRFWRQVSRRAQKLYVKTFGRPPRLPL